MISYANYFKLLNQRLLTKNSKVSIDKTELQSRLLWMLSRIAFVYY